MKFCKDCAHFYQTRSSRDGIFAECRRPNGGQLDPVMGVRSYLTCAMERSKTLDSYCGYDAKFFQPTKK